MSKRIRNVIFDIDGTLVESNDAHAHAWVEAMAAYGHRIPFAQVRPLIGMGGDKVLPETLGIAKESAEGRQISKRRKSIFFAKYLPTIRPFSQARQLLQYLHDHGLVLVTATSAEPDELQQLLQIVGPHTQDLFAQETSAKDVKHSKPDPDVMHAALQRINGQAAETLMVGDTAYDIEAAAKVGIKTLAFRCGGWSDAELQGALAIYDGPADLLMHYQESALAQT